MMFLKCFIRLHFVPFYVAVFNSDTNINCNTKIIFSTVNNKLIMICLLRNFFFAACF